MNNLYFDSAATTYPVQSVLEAVTNARWENPSTINKYGTEARSQVERVRRQIQKLLRCEEKEVIFTSGGTEANNTAIFSALGVLLSGHSHEEKERNARRKVYIAGLEHSSVYDCLYFLEQHQKLEIVELSVDRNGRLILDGVDLKGALVCVSHVNNEIGTVTDVAEISRKINALPANARPKLLVDGVQALGKIEIGKVIEAVKLSDYYSISAHKIHGLKGVGALIASARIVPFHIGGSQEKGFRAGTENTAGIMGFGKALELVEKNPVKDAGMPLDKGVESFSEGISGAENQAKIESARAAKTILLQRLKEHFEEGGFVVNSPEDGSSYILSISIKGVKSEVMIHMLAEKGISVSSGSACSSHKDTLSRIIKKIGAEKEYADGTLRISFAPDYFYKESDKVIRVEDVKYLAKAIYESACEIQKYYRF